MTINTKQSPSPVFYHQIANLGEEQHLIGGLWRWLYRTDDQEYDHGYHQKINYGLYEQAIINRSITNLKCQFFEIYPSHQDAYEEHEYVSDQRVDNRGKSRSYN
jgi:hypothetical protein